MSLTSEFEFAIAHHRLSGPSERLQLDEFILPHYGGYSIANLPATIAGFLGVELAGAAPPLPPHAWADLATDVRSVVVVVLDAVGYLHFQRALAKEDSIFSRLAEAGRLVPLTSVFPSATMTAMTTLWTGRTPGNHGFLGTKLFLSEQGVLANMIRLAPTAHRPPGALLDWGWSPEDFVPVPGLAQQLAAGEVQSVAHIYQPYIGSGLARIFFRGVTEVQGYVGLSDMWINLRHTLIRRSEKPLFVNVYWSGTDDVAHIYGPDGERFAAALRHLARSMEEDFLDPLPAAVREGTLLIITADHGQTATPPERAVHLSDHPFLARMLLLPPAAEPRAAYLYVRPGQAEAVRAYVAKHLADRFLLLETERALAAGLFGPEKFSPELSTRVGDLLLLARDDSQLIVDEKTVYHGHHGSLTPEEMLVPLIMVRLDWL